MASRYPISKQKQSKIDQQRQESFKELLYQIQNGRTILYTDEIVFKPYQINYKTWSKKGINQEMAKEGLQLKTKVAIVSISREKGLEGYLIKQKSINIEDLKLMIELSVQGDDLPLTIFWDNLKSHYNKDLLKQIKKLGWNYVFNAPYSCQFNCIEEYFSLVKRHYKKMLVQKNFKLSEKEHEDIVKQSFETVPIYIIQKLVDRHVQK